MDFHRITEVECGIVFQGLLAVLEQWVGLWHWYRSRGFRLNLPVQGDEKEYWHRDYGKFLISFESGVLYHVRKIN